MLKKINIKKSGYLALLFLLPLLLNAQKKRTDKNDYYDARRLRYEDYTYLPSIKTVQCYNAMDEQSASLIRLNSEDQIQLSFDELSTEVRNLFYTVEHCDAFWNPSNLPQTDYLSGFPEDRISDYRFSYGTLVHYVHYRMMFPNDQMKVLLSGNYLLKVYEDNDPNRLVITRRMMVSDPKLQIDATIARSPVINDRNSKQKVNFRVIYSGMNIENPFDQLKIIVTQNNRWDNAQLNTTPVFIRDGELIYDNEDKNVFNGLNEFRRFDIRTIRFRGGRVDNIVRDTTTEVYVSEDYSRAGERYVSNPDLDGKYFIRYTEGNNPDLQSDYVNTHFTIPMDVPLMAGNIYLFGKLTDWKISDEYKMKYNDQTNAYELITPLKQGVYDYMYLLNLDEKNKMDETFFEGNHYETENIYTLYAYFRRTGSRYDELIGIRQIAANPLVNQLIIK